jgi:hypothetical protein
MDVLRVPLPYYKNVVLKIIHGASVEKNGIILVPHSFQTELS